MALKTFLEEKKITVTRLAKISGVPRTTVNDICTGKSSIDCCNVKTIYLIAKALGCTMEELVEYDGCDKETGKPLDKSYLECGLPSYLQSSIKAMVESWKIVDSGEMDLHWDLYWCELNADINCAEVDQEITSEQAWYLRDKYLRMER